MGKEPYCSLPILRMDGTSSCAAERIQERQDVEVIALENLKRTTCECGYQFTPRNISIPLRPVPKGFYNGNVKRFSDAICPECLEAYVLWIRPTGQSWKVVTMSKAVQLEEEAEKEAGPDEFESMEQAELREWLDAREVKYMPRTGVIKLRELARSTIKRDEALV